MVLLIMKKFTYARSLAAVLSVGSVTTTLMAQSLEINPVVVSATRLEQPLSEVLSSVSVITRADIDKAQATTLAELLQGEAGYEFGRNGGPGTTTSFFLRGEESKNVVIFIDGVKSQTDSLGAQNRRIAALEYLVLPRPNHPSTTHLISSSEGRKEHSPSDGLLANILERQSTSFGT